MPARLHAAPGAALIVLWLRLCSLALPTLHGLPAQPARRCAGAHTRLPEPSRKVRVRYWADRRRALARRRATRVACPARPARPYRRHAAPRVCRQLRQLADSPALNATASVEFDDRLPRLRSFCKWLGRHRGSVRELRLQVYAEELSASHKEQASTLLKMMLASCSMAGSLQLLQLTTHGHDFPCSAWVAQLHSLHALSLDCSNEDSEYMGLEGPLQHLTRLQDLELDGNQCCFLIDKGCALPASLTRILLCFDEAESLPRQVR